MSDTDLTRKQRSLILISGMHRSGTSALARVLNISGAKLPATLLVPIKGENDKGFWESQKFMEFNDEVLKTIGGGQWNLLNSIPSAWFQSDQAQQFQTRLIKLIDEEFGEFDVGVVKDPRLCLLFPMWEAALSELGISLLPIIAVRSPLEISESLQVRNGYTQDYALQLWFHYLTAVERSTRQLNRLFISFDNLLGDARDVIHRVNEAFDLDLDGTSDEFATHVGEFLNRDLRHHRVKDEDLAESIRLPDNVKQLYRWLVDSSTRAPSEEPRSAGSELRVDLASDISSFSLIRQSVEQFERHLNQSHHEIQRLNQQVSRVSAEKNGLEQHVSSLDQNLQDQRQRLEQSEQNHHRLLEQHLDLESTHLRLERDNLSLQNSYQQVLEDQRGLSEKLHDLSIKLNAFQREQSRSQRERRQLDKHHEAQLTAKDQLLDRARLLESLNPDAKPDESLIDNNKMTQFANENAILSQRLRDVERRLHDLQHTAAWRIGAFATRKIRQCRNSLLGQLLLWIKALVSLNLVRYWRYRKSVTLVQRSGLFDEAYYLATYPLIQYSSKSPVEHYVGIGEREGRQPNAVFLPYFYAQKHPQESAKHGGALAHYIKEGADLGYDPCPTFSTEFYAKANGLEKSDALAHFLSNNPQHPSQSKTAANTQSGADILSSAPAGANSITGSVDGPIKQEIDAVLSELTTLTPQQKLSRLQFSASHKPKVSVIIPFFNKFDFTLDCLYTLSQQSFTDFEVILIDDASNETNELNFELIDGITYIANKTNQGYLKSCNLAVQASKGEYVVQLNNDTLVLQGWLENLLDTFAVGPNVGLAGSLLLSIDGRISEAGGVIFHDASGYNYGRGKSPYHKRFNYHRDTDYCSGASIMVRRDLWDSLGGYDEHFAPAYYEDTDIAMQIRQQGYRVVINPHSKAVHHEGVSSGTDIGTGIKQYQAVNKEKFFAKWQQILAKKPPKPDGDNIDQYVRQERSSGWILWVDSVTPTPDKDSGSIDTVNFFKHVIDRDWGVTFLPWDGVRHEGKYTTDLQKMGVECICDSALSADQHLYNLEDDYRVIVLSRVTVAKYAYPIIKQRYPNAKIIFNTVDLHFLRYQRETDLLAENPSQTLKVRSQFVDKQEELTLVDDCDATIVVSDDEKNVLQQYLPDANVHVIPLFREVVGCSNTFSQRANIGFIGGYRHPPNVDAVNFFVREVWPLVKNQLPHCKFVIAGSHPPDEILNLDSADIEVRGFIPTVTELMEEVRIMVAPLRYGAGIKGKIVSGLCHGLPQVASQAAAEGMGLEHKENIMIANDAEQFADYIVELYQNEQLWADLSASALALANQCYSQSSIEGKITALLSDL